MKKYLFFLLMTAAVFLGSTQESKAQCSICTKTAQQLGEKPAKALNEGIIYLAFTPLLIIGYVSYKWYKNNKHNL